MNQALIPPSLQELQDRMARFRRAMDQACPDWETAVILSKVNQYYFLGTMQDGMLLIRRGGDAWYFVRRSFERARDESYFPAICAMESYRDAAGTAGRELGVTYMETEVATLAILDRMKKHFDIAGIGSLDRIVLSLRAVKSPYELQWMERSGAQHHYLLDNVVPGLLREGMSEAELVAVLYENMVARGYQGICRFSMFQAEMVVGQVGFAQSSLYPTSFDGPGGARGMCAAVPLVGSRENKLRHGDLVFVDIAFGMNGYHSDRTQVYQFGKEPAEEVRRAHRLCMDIQSRLADMLLPGAIPSDIYASIMNGMTDEMKTHFMGFGSRSTKFLGHGVGLHVDEYPVLAGGFRQPLQSNMTVALEPKKGVAGVGMAGVEDTYVVTGDGGRCITGGGREIIIV